MKFKIEKNIFAPDITEVDLTGKEIEYISMLISGVKQLKIKQLLYFDKADFENLYTKFGLTDKSKIRYMQIATISAMNNLISDEILHEVYLKYGTMECEEMIKILKTNNDKD